MKVYRLLIVLMFYLVYINISSAITLRNDSTKLIDVKVYAEKLASPCISQKALSPGQEFTFSSNSEYPACQYPKQVRVWVNSSQEPNLIGTWCSLRGDSSQNLLPNTGTKLAVFNGAKGVNCWTITTGKHF